MKRLLIATLGGGAALGLVVGIHTAVSESHTPPPTSQTSASSSCGYSTADTSYTAVVIGTGPVCSDLAADLAGTGSYWAPYTATPTTGMVCDLTSGGSTMVVWDVSSEGEPIGGGVAQDVCSAEEGNGWTPAQPPASPTYTYSAQCAREYGAQDAWQTTPGGHCVANPDA